MRYQAGGSAFRIAGLPVARDAAIIDAGLDVAISGRTRIGISYNGQIGSRLAYHAAKASISFSFLTMDDLGCRHRGRRRPSPGPRASLYRKARGPVGRAAVWAKGG